jgi:chaperonin cofactor prefoldin
MPENFVRGNPVGRLSGNKLVNRRAEKVRDTYRKRLDRLESVEKGLRKASRDLAKDMEKATAEMRKRIKRQAPGGQVGQD